MLNFINFSWVMFSKIVQILKNALNFEVAQEREHPYPKYWNVSRRSEILCLKQKIQSFPMNIKMPLLEPQKSLPEKCLNSILLITAATPPVGRFIRKPSEKPLMQTSYWMWSQMKIHAFEIKLLRKSGKMQCNSSSCR